MTNAKLSNGDILKCCFTENYGCFQPSPVIACSYFLKPDVLLNVCKPDSVFKHVQLINYVFK